MAAPPQSWGEVPASSDDEAAAGRAHTMLLALERLRGARALASSGRPLALLVLGPDAREGSSARELARTFEPFVRALLACRPPGAADERPLDVSLVLVGPNLPCAGSFDRAVRAASGRDARRAILRVTCVQRMLHEGECEPALALPGGRRFACAFAFNAGLWGYDGWPRSVRRLGELGDVPLVVTSYNELEADDDAGALEAMGLEEALDWLWAPEPNPFAGRTAWPNSLGRLASDNGWWQCVDARRSGRAAG